MRDHRTIGVYVRALRVPFITASILPFLCGSFLVGSHFQLLPFLLGLVCVASTHLGANLINDYADSYSGVDWQDRRWYVFFGGSKLIQEGVLSAKFYLLASVFFFVISLLSVITLAWMSNDIAIIGYCLCILFLGISYSCGPLRFSYRYFGEVIIFLLFGPVVVMGAYFIQTGIFPDFRSFIVSLPFGFFTTAILYSNEIPDLPEDRKGKKFNWASLTGLKNAFIVYGVLLGLGFAMVGLNIACGYLSLLSMAAFILVIPGLRACEVIRSSYNDKQKLMDSSRLTIMVKAVVSIIILIDILL